MEFLFLANTARVTGNASKPPPALLGAPTATTRVRAYSTAYRAPLLCGPYGYGCGRMNSAYTLVPDLATSSVAPAPCFARARPCLDVWWGEPFLVPSTHFRLVARTPAWSRPHGSVAARGRLRRIKLRSVSTEPRGIQSCKTHRWSPTVRLVVLRSGSGYGLFKELLDTGRPVHPSTYLATATPPPSFNLSMVIDRWPYSPVPPSYLAAPAVAGNLVDAPHGRCSTEYSE